VPERRARNIVTTHSEISTRALAGVMQDVPSPRPQYSSEMQPSTWSVVGRPDGRYARPDDVGPVVVAQEVSHLAKVGKADPTAWARFRAEVGALTQETSTALGSSLGDGRCSAAISVQAAAHSSGAAGNSWQVDINHGLDRNLLASWTRLTSRGCSVVYKGLNAGHRDGPRNGEIAAHIGAVWGHRSEKANREAATGNGRVPYGPERDASDPVLAHISGSVVAAKKMTDPGQAGVESAEWMTTPPAPPGIASERPGYTRRPSTRRSCPTATSPPCSCGAGKRDRCRYGSPAGVLVFCVGVPARSPSTPTCATPGRSPFAPQEPMQHFLRSGIRNGRT